MGELTPRERVLLALCHAETDRVHVGFQATPETWVRSGSSLGTDDSELILRKLGVDLRHLRQPYVGPSHRAGGDGAWMDEWGVSRRRVEHPGGSYDEIVRHPPTDRSPSAAQVPPKVEFDDVVVQCWLDFRWMATNAL